MKTLRAATLASMLVMVAVAADAELRFNAETGAIYNSNLSNSDRDGEVRDDWAWKSDVRISDGLQLTRDLRLSVAADLRSELWARFDDFSEIGPGLISGLRYRFGLGREAPWLLLENRFGYDRFQDTARSGYDETVELRGGIGLTQQIALELGYSFENFAAPNDFYDRQIHRAGTRVILDLTSALRLAIGYQYREGDVISYAVPPRPEIAALSVEREDDDTFGTPLRTAYRLLGRTHSVSVSAAYGLTKNLSVQIGYEYAITLHDPLQYENHLVDARLVFVY
jgi:hypothetical protein